MSSRSTACPHCGYIPAGGNIGTVILLSLLLLIFGAGFALSGTCAVMGIGSLADGDQAFGWVLGAIGLPSSLIFGIVTWSLGKRLKRAWRELRSPSE